MIPDVRVFLDVDDLAEGRGAEYVDASEVVLIFVSTGYFRSQNVRATSPLHESVSCTRLATHGGRAGCVQCMRELLRAVFRQKTKITLVESESGHGSLTQAEVQAKLEQADTRYRQQWGDANLGDEIGSWLAASTHSSGHLSLQRTEESSGRALCQAIVHGESVAPQLLHILYDSAPLEWNRLGTFQVRLSPLPCGWTTRSAGRE